MSIPATALSPLPDVARLRPRQQMAMDCVLCARPLGMRGRRLGEARHLGLPFQLWACAPEDRFRAQALAYFTKRRSTPA